MTKEGYTTIEVEFTQEEWDRIAAWAVQHHAEDAIKEYLENHPIEEAVEELVREARGYVASDLGIVAPFASRSLIVRLANTLEAMNAGRK